MKKLYLLLLINIFILTVMSQTTYYVSTTGNDDNAGTSWSSAFATLAKANTVAVSGDEVRVTAGVYTFSAQVRIERSYSIRGSYNAQGVQDYSAKTILDGNNATRILMVNNSGGAQISIGLDGLSFRNANSSGYSGAVCFDKSIGRITNCEFINNLTTNYNGGGLAFLNGKDATNVISNCLFAGNSAKWGGGIFAGSNEILSIADCTFANNSAIGSDPQGGAMFCNGFLTFNNNIVYGNTMGETNQQIVNSNGTTATLAANTNIIQNSLAGYSGTITFANDALTDASDIDPLFVDAANGDFHLQSTSPAVDYGNGDVVPAGITTDLDGNTRFFNDLVDLGCYEYVPTTGVKSVSSINVSISPNPVSDYLQISSDKPMNKIQIFDLSGRILMQQNANGKNVVSLNTSDLASGIYFVNVDSKYTSKVVCK